jgi:hypothetical protein
MSVTRPDMLAGPIDRHRKPASVAESRGVVSWAESEPAYTRALARAERTVWACIGLDGLLNNRSGKRIAKLRG